MRSGVGAGLKFEVKEIKKIVGRKVVFHLIKGLVDVSFALML